MSDLGFWTIAANDPGRLSLVEPEGNEVTFGELRANANRISHGLRRLGLEAGDGVAMVMWNRREFVETVLATSQIGLYFTAVNFHLTGPEIAYIVGDCEAKVFIGDVRFAESCTAAMDELSFPEERRFATDGISGFRDFIDLTDGMPDDPPADRTAGQTMLYTSGTTGRPKGVRRPLSGADPDAAAAAGGLLAGLFDIAPGEGVHLVAGPLYHAAPLAFGSGALNLGQTLVLMDKWTPESTLELIDRYKVTSSHMVPTMFHRLLALADDVKARYDVSSVRNIIHAAAQCPVDVKQRMIEWWGEVVYEYYAATEVGGTYVKPKDWLEHPGTVGQPWPGSEVKVLDDDGNEVPPGEPGTIYMKSAAQGSFEYYKDSEKTKANRRGDLVTVGDIGYMTEDNWLYLHDRKSDMIIVGGVNIYPAEVEGILLTHPKVGDAAVIGVPHPEYGEEVKAVIEPADGVEPSDELASELVAFCQSKLAKFKCPRSVDFRDELPRYPTGKLYKRLIRDEYWAGAEKKI